MFIRNMPVGTSLQRWNQWKPVNRVITFQPTACHPRKHHRWAILSQRQCQASISSIRWPWLRRCTIKQVEHPPPLRIPPTRQTLHQQTFGVQIPFPHQVPCPWRPPMPLHLRRIHRHQHWMETIRTTISILIITDRMARRRITITMDSIFIHRIMITAVRRSLPPLDTGRTPLNPTSPAQHDSTWPVNHQRRVPSVPPECLTPRHPPPNKILPITHTDPIRICRKWLEHIRPVTNSTSSTTRNTANVAPLFLCFLSSSSSSSSCFQM